MMTKHHHRYTVCVDCLLQLVPMRGGSKFMFSLSFSNARSEFLRFFNVCSFWRELTSSSITDIIIILFLTSREP